MSLYPVSPIRSYEAGSNAVLSPPPLVLAEEPPRRPRSIDAAIGLIALTTGIGLLIAAIAFGSLHHFNSTFRPAVAPLGATDSFIGQVETVVRVSLSLVGASALILAITQAALASGVVRGNRGARVGMWVLAAVGVGCAVLTLFTMVVAHSTAPLDSSGPTGAAVVQAAQDSIPGWTTGVVGVLALFQALAYVSAAILLAAPSATQFFERIMRPWRPGDGSAEEMEASKTLEAADAK